jgi:hypothetical protein
MTEPRRAGHGRNRMPSASADPIVQDIQRILERGLDLSAETVRFIDSTFAHPSTAELSALLADDAVPERDSLLELLFSPDEALQIEIEDRLSLQPPEAHLTEAVAARLAAAPRAVRFRFPDGRDALEVVMTAPLARRFVLALGIDRNLPACVGEAVAAHGSRGRTRLVRVMLRNARFEFTPACKDFLCALVTKLDVAEDEGRACLAFALEILAEPGASSDVCASLVARKKWLSRAVHHSRRVREQLAQSNVETLLSQGQRLTLVDEALACRQMGYIDRICIAVFGLSLPADADGWRQPVAFEGPLDMAGLMRRPGRTAPDSV